MKEEKLKANERIISRRRFLQLLSFLSGGLLLGEPGVIDAEGSSLPQSVLTPEEQARIYRSSLSFLAPTHAAAIQVARSIDFIPGSNLEDPSNMCGPLAIATLNTAGITTSIAPAEFWLWRPSSGARQRTKLKAEGFELVAHPREAIVFWDFKKNPLTPGDFLYVYAGWGGTFEHMLVVSRVDEMGRAYAVTNRKVSTRNYVIEELLLYDPNLVRTGWFYEWTNPKNYKNGQTGFGGFDLWRKTSRGPRAEDGLVMGEDLEKAVLRQRLEAILAASGGHWAVYVKELPGEVIETLSEDETLHPASTIKVVIAVLLFTWLERQPFTQGEFFALGPGTGRSWGQLLEAMLVKSEEAATEELTQFISTRRGFDFMRELDALGLTKTRLKPRRSSARDLGQVLESLYLGQHLNEESRERILQLLSTYTVSDQDRLGRVRRIVPQAVIYNKRGSMVDDQLIVADTGIIVVPNSKPLIACFLGYHGKKGEATYDQLEKCLNEVGEELGRYVALTTRKT